MASLDLIEKLDRLKLKSQKYEFEKNYIKVPHNSTPISEYSHEHLVYSYPTLFPYGKSLYFQMVLSYQKKTSCTFTI
jgi:hypothetical protein